MMGANNEHNEPLSEKEQALFEQLKKEMQPPHNLEAGVVRSLRAKNLLAKNKKTMTRSFIIGIAASLTALACGFFIGKNFDPKTTTVTAMNKYILLLYENDDFQGKEESQMIEEYTHWAMSLSEKGKLDNAEKLADQGEWLGTASTKNKESHVVGYFVVLARNYEEALSLAKTHPHIGYGGGLELRPIEKLD